MNEAQKAKWKASASKALERAEKIKSFVEKKKAGGSTSTPGQTEGVVPGVDLSEMRLTPVRVDHFSPREWPFVQRDLKVSHNCLCAEEQFLVVKKGETINGRLYPPWDEPVVQSSPPRVNANGHQYVRRNE